MGKRLGTADRWGRRDREGSERVGERNDADRPGPWGSERERGGERARWSWRRQTGPACQALRSRGRSRAWSGISGPTWAELGFPFSREFLIAFIFFSLGFLIQIQIKFQIQTKSNMCNNSKNIWSST
jgi:hypothetical protein